MKIICALTLQYEGQSLLLAYIPSEGNIMSRKSYLNAKKGEAKQIEYFADLNNWAGLRMYPSTDVFFGDQTFDRTADEAKFAAGSPGFQNGKIVLKCFQHSFKDGDAVKESVLLSRHVACSGMFCMLWKASNRTASLPLLMAHKIYTMVRIRLYATVFILQSNLLHSLIQQESGYWSRLAHTGLNSPRSWCTPKTLCRGRTCSYAYKALFCTVTDCTERFFGLQLNVRYGSLDHASYIAYLAVLPDIIRLDCYAHVLRKCSEKVGLLNDSKYFDASIAISMKQLHLTRFPEQFQAVCQLYLQRWRSDNEDTYANWFEKA